MLEGTGIGPEVVGAALKVFAAVGEMLDLEFKIEPGPELREQPTHHGGPPQFVSSAG